MMGKEEKTVKAVKRLAPLLNRDIFKIPFATREPTKQKGTEKIARLHLEVKRNVFQRISQAESASQEQNQGPEIQKEKQHIMKGV